MHHLLAADDLFGLDDLDATLLSVYMQVVVLLSVGRVLRSLKVEGIDFEVYKEDPALA